MKRTQSVDQYIRESKYWRSELKTLRDVLRSSGLDEGIKWGAPCFSYDGKNVVGIGAFKSYFGLWFYQGALLADDKRVLINAQEGKTKALRQWRMTSGKDIRSSIIKRYIKESIGHAVAGRVIKADRSKPVDVPGELRNALRRRQGATVAFDRLRKGLQREYAEYIVDAKQTTTKIRRIEKILPMIEQGIGLNDRYRR